MGEKRTVSFIENDIECFEELHLGFLLIDAHTGVTYEVQVGGSVCSHPVLEGYAIPVSGPF